jgi:hypothetical protein
MPEVPGMAEICIAALVFLLFQSVLMIVLMVFEHYSFSLPLQAQQGRRLSL